LWGPLSGRVLLAEDVVAGLRLEHSAQGENVVGIVCTRLSGPVTRR
jgi:hypothetical protein